MSLQLGDRLEAYLTEEEMVRVGLGLPLSTGLPLRYLENVFSRNSFFLHSSFGWSTNDFPPEMTVCAGGHLTGTLGISEWSRRPRGRLHVVHAHWACTRQRSHSIGQVRTEISLRVSVCLSILDFSDLMSVTVQRDDAHGFDTRWTKFYHLSKTCHRMKFWKVCTRCGYLSLIISETCWLCHQGIVHKDMAPIYKN